MALPSPIDINIHSQVDKATEKVKLDKDGKPEPPKAMTRDRQLFYQSFVTKTIYTALQKRLLSISIRTQFTKPNVTDRSWIVEMIFNGTPLQSSHSKEQGNRRAVYFHYEMLSMDSIGKTVDQMLAHWMKIVLLYGLVHDFAELYNADKYNLKNIVSIKSYSYTNLLMTYGHNKVGFLVCLNKIQEKVTASSNSDHSRLLNREAHFLEVKFRLKSILEKVLLNFVGLTRFKI